MILVDASVIADILTVAGSEQSFATVLGFLLLML